MYVDEDAICPTGRNKELASLIPTNDGEITLYGRNHENLAGANDKEFV